MAVEGVCTMSELHKISIEDEIIELLEEKAPLSLMQISDQLSITKATGANCLRRLIDDGKVLKLQAKNSNKSYYLINKEATLLDVSNMHTEIAKETIEVKDTYENLAKKYDKVSENVNSIYANIISIMSIFVAIFALITVNANIAFELTTQNMQDVFWGIIKINIFVVICIIALLVGVRLIIINPLLEKKKKDNKKSERG